jgi:putative component of toxin-antitoxin plasmid stabilization module
MSFEPQYKMITRLLLQIVFLFLTVAAQVAGGDLVYSYDTLTGEVSQQEVTDTFVRTTNHIRYLTTVDAEGDEQVIATTDEHPFWVVSESGSRYVDAKDLQIGNIFIGANGELTTLTVTNRVGYPDGITVYNFTVADNHNYFVVASLEAYQNGASVVLVHNADCTVTSQIKDKGLIRAVEKAEKNQQVQQDIDNMVFQLQQGNMNPGTKNRFLFNGIFEARSANGARVYFRNTENGIEILAKSDKHNQTQVIQLLRRLYGK